MFRRGFVDSGVSDIYGIEMKGRIIERKKQIKFAALEQTLRMRKYEKLQNEKTRRERSKLKKLCGPVYPRR